MSLLRLIVISIFLVVITGCQGQKESKEMEKTTNIEFMFGEPFELFFKRYPMMKLIEQPVGANFYKMRWSEESPANILFNQDGYNIEIPHVISVLVYENTERTDEGITQFQLSSGITYDKTISHDEARLKFYQFLQDLLDKGWKRTIAFSDPRLSGAQSMQYLREHESYYSSDARYIPTLKEWRSLRALGTYWEFHADNKAFLKISLERKDNKTNPDIGVYLMNIELKNANEELRAHFHPEEKKYFNDPKKWGSIKSDLLKTRAKIEKDLLSKGYEIDESYENYDIKPE